MGAADERSHRDIGREAVADAQRTRGLDKTVARLHVDRPNRQQNGAGETTLAGAAVKRFRQDGNRAIEIGVGHDDHEVLRAAERLHTFARVRRSLIDVPGDWR